jgi:hypothetical protein
MARIDSCRVCGCTDERGCEDGCEWIQPGLCSACLGAVRATRCPDCGSTAKFCKRPSGHSGPFVAYHSARITATKKAMREMFAR